MSLRVVDLYFFEEISRTCGREAGIQWLLNETKRKKCGMQGEIAENFSSSETNRPRKLAQRGPMQKKFYRLRIMRRSFALAFRTFRRVLLPVASIGADALFTARMKAAIISQSTSKQAVAAA